MKTDVLILGGGHAGVRAAREIVRRRRPGEALQVGLISRDNVEIWHGLMPQIISNVVQPQHVIVPLRESLKGVSVFTYEIRDIDLAGKRVTVDRGLDTGEVAFQYRTLVIALGSVLDVSRFPGMTEHALPTKTVGDFLHLRNHVIEMLEAGAEETDPAVRAEMLTFVVAGAGFAGVEVAAAIEELIRQSLRLYPKLSRKDVRIVLLDIVNRVLPSLREEVSAMAKRYLERHGVEVTLGVGVKSVSMHEVLLTNGQSIRTRNVIATAGTGSHPLVAKLPVEVVRGRIKCDEMGRVVGCQGVFAAGDVAAIPGPDGNPYPPTVTFAVAEGETVGANVVASYRGQPLKRCEHEAVGQVGIMSRTYAVAQSVKKSREGRRAVLMGRLKFLGYMPNWQRKARLVIDWTTAHLFRMDVTELDLGRSQAVSKMRFSPGDEIVREGELGNYFYVVSDGEVEVIEHTDGEGKVVRKIGPGGYFGEIALRQGIRRTASVRAVKETSVLALHRRDFVTLSSTLPMLVSASPQTAGPPEKT